MLEVARSHGYERVDPPLAEFADGLASRLKAGGLTDAVRFVDPVSPADAGDPARSDRAGRADRGDADGASSAPGAAVLCRLGAEAARVASSRPRANGGRSGAS